MSKLSAIGVVGAGAMGAGIAQVALTAGLDVILFDQNEKALHGAGEAIGQRIARLAEKGQIPAHEAEAARARLKLAADLDDLAACDLVVEAIIESLAPKQALFAALEDAVRDDAVLATNTSSLSVAAIARDCRRPERVCGLHFFNPVPLMKLVEVIDAPATSPEAFALAWDFSLKIGKTPVRVADGPGFLVNLGGRAYSTEALHIRQEGVADEAAIDRIMRQAAGFRMGPFELMDLTGIDVNFPASTFIWQGYMNDPRLKTTAQHQLMFNAGRFGRKTGQGFHRYGADAAPADAAALADDGRSVLEVATPEDTPALAALAHKGLAARHDDGACPILVAPVGEDAATYAVRNGLDGRRVVAIDLYGLPRNFVTLMTPPGGQYADRVAAWLNARGVETAIVKDSPGFVAPRILAMIANLGCEMAQIGVGAPSDIDLAMRLGLNYPLGPLELAERVTPPVLLRTLENLQAITGSDRYRPSLWLRRRAQLGLPIHTPD